MAGNELIPSNFLSQGECHMPRTQNSVRWSLLMSSNSDMVEDKEAPEIQLINQENLWENVGKKQGIKRMQIQPIPSNQYSYDNVWLVRRKKYSMLRIEVLDFNMHRGSRGRSSHWWIVRWHPREIVAIRKIISLGEGGEQAVVAAVDQRIPKSVQCRCEWAWRRRARHSHLKPHHRKQKCRKCRSHRRVISHGPWPRNRSRRQSFDRSDREKEESSKTRKLFRGWGLGHMKVMNT